MKFSSIRYVSAPFLAATALLAMACGNIEAADKIVRLGFLSDGAEPPQWRERSVIHRTLKELGWLEGQNLTVEARWADGELERLPELAAELGLDHSISTALATREETLPVLLPITTTTKVASIRLGSGYFPIADASRPEPFIINVPDALIRVGLFLVNSARGSSGLFCQLPESGGATVHIPKERASLRALAVGARLHAELHDGGVKGGPGVRRGQATERMTVPTDFTRARPTCGIWSRTIKL